MLDTINNNQPQDGASTPPTVATNQPVVPAVAPVAQPVEGPGLRPKPQQEKAPRIDSLDTPKINIFTWMTVVASIIFILGHIVFVLVMINNESTIAREQKVLTQRQQDIERQSALAQRATNLKTASTELDGYLNKQMDWGKVWSEINTRLLTRSRIEAMSMDEKGTVKITGETTTLSDLAKTLVSFQRSETIKDIRLVSSSFSISQNTTTVNFSLEGAFDLSKVRKEPK